MDGSVGALIRALTFLNIYRLAFKCTAFAMCQHVSKCTPALSGFAPVLPRPSPRVLQNALQCVLKLQRTSKQPHWITDRIVDSPHTRPERVKSRYEDASQRCSSHVAKDPEAVRCSQSLLVGRRFCGKLDWAAPTQVRAVPGRHRRVRRHVRKQNREGPSAAGSVIAELCLMMGMEPGFASVKVVEDGDRTACTGRMHVVLPGVPTPHATCCRASSTTTEGTTPMSPTCAC